jgi:phosphate transport system substrate-binding protein
MLKSDLIMKGVYMNKITTAVIIAGLIIPFLVLGGYAEVKSVELQGNITISGAWALYPMALKWAEEFQKLYPKVKIDISAGGAGKGMADCLSKVVDIGMVSRDIYPEELNKGAWVLSVTKDAVVPTINARNPVIKELLAKGITKEVFEGIFVTENIKTWGAAVNSAASGVIDVYTRSDACGAGETWAKYLGKKQEDLTGIGVYGDPGVAEAVRKDTLGIGYNNINYAYDAGNKGPVEGILVIPIDLNADGRIEENEDFYASLDTVTAAIADGRYPSPPARELFFVANGRPGKKEVREFLRWVLTDGQKFVPATGYIKITDEQIGAGLKKLGED